MNETVCLNQALVAFRRVLDMGKLEQNHRAMEDFTNLETNYLYSSIQKVDVKGRDAEHMDTTSLRHSVQFFVLPLSWMKKPNNLSD